MTAGKTAGTHDVKHKAEFKVKLSDEHSLKAVGTNKSIESSWTYSPEFLNKDGMNSTVEIEGKFTPKDNKCHSKAEFKFGGFELGPIKPWMEVSNSQNYTEIIFPSRFKFFNFYG